MKKLLFTILLAALAAGAGYLYLPRFLDRPAPVPAGAAPLTGINAASGGFGHTLAVKGDRTVWSWGSNEFGQLGDGTTRDRDSAVQVRALSGITAVAAGGDHSMALAGDGTVWTWGSNEFGQLGDATPVFRPTPREVRGMLMVRSIAAGGSHSLALKHDGTVLAWGANGKGQLGDGTQRGRSEARVVSGIAGAVAIASGLDHGAALMADGSVMTWGANGSGQLGDGTTQDRSRPATVARLANVVAIACGYEHTLALMHDGTVRAWGANDRGQLGDGTLEMRTQPVQVRGLEGIIAIAAGHRHSLALIGSGDVVAWGSNRHHQLGRSSGVWRTKPVGVSGISGPVASIASGGYHVLAVGTDGTLSAWGFNLQGQLGNGSRAYQHAPVSVFAAARGEAAAPRMASASPGQGASIIVSIAGGRTHSVAVQGDGSVWAWGDNFYGQLGDGQRHTIKPFPQVVNGVGIVTQVAAGNGFTLALRQDGTIWAWGHNENRQLGEGSQEQSRAVPTIIEGLDLVKAIAAKGYVSLAVREDGTVWKWGMTQRTVEIAPPQVPVPVSGLANIQAVATGHEHFLALGSDGTVWAWGKNDFGQVGDGRTVDRHGPVRVEGLDKMVAIAAGRQQSAALRTDGTVFVWGQVRKLQKNIYESIATTPVPLQGLKDVTAIAAGDVHMIALRKDGTVWGWGSGGQSQLGVKGVGTNMEPFPVEHIDNVTAIAAGWYHNLAVRKDGTLWAWGYNEFGQVGDGTQGVAEHGSKSHDKRMLGKRVPNPVRPLATQQAAAVEPQGPGVKAISAGGTFSVLLMEDGTVRAWGDNSQHQLGNREDVVLPDGSKRFERFSTHKPFPIRGLANVEAVDAGMFHSLALKRDGTVYQWGRSYENVAQEQNIESLSFSARVAHDRSLSRGRGSAPAAMLSPAAGLTEVEAVSAGAGFSLALRLDGTVWAWGVNNYGQLGDGTTSFRREPKPVPGLSDIQAVAAGQAYALALHRDGTVWAWGITSYRKQGKQPVPQTSLAPVRVTGLTGVTAIAATGEPLALMSDGTVWSCWTWLRDDPASFGPAPIPGIDGVKEISSEGDHTLLLGRNGLVTLKVFRSWRQEGAMVMQRQMEVVPESEDAVAASAGWGHGLLLKRDGTVWAWGDNEFGQLGDQTKHDSRYPVPIEIP